jgi:hypothetical protein
VCAFACVIFARAQRLIGFGACLVVGMMLSIVVRGRR